MSIPNDLYQAHLLVSDPKGGRAVRHAAGRFVVKDGSVYHLEDYHGRLAGTIPEGTLSKSTEQAIRNPGPDLSVAGMRDVASGRRLDFVPRHRFSGALPSNEAASKGGAETSKGGARSYFYHRAGYDRPHVLEARAGALALDGSELSPEEAHVVMENLRSGAAELRPIESEELAKADLKDWTPESALAHLEGKTGDEESADAVSALRRHLFEDPMNPGIGNKYAYNQHRLKNHPGTWASLDMNDFKHVNDVYGHETGDELIRAVGSAFRAGADPAKVKLFRSGGDEYALHAQAPEDAYAAVRAMRARLDELPPIMGSYHPSVSVGFGNDFETADRALRLAKAGKFLPAGGRAYVPGAVPHLAHSLVPGHEGPVPLSNGVSGPTSEELAAPVLAASANGPVRPEAGLGVQSSPATSATSGTRSANS